ncbi:MAG: tripartite tricarboxylate transporter substrate binding protein [Pseudomonadota bacterium]
MARRKSVPPVLCALLCALAPLAFAQQQAYPTHTIRIVEPVGPGSAPDVFARKLTPGLAERLGQAIIVDNKAGANGAIGAQEVARAAPDGYTLLHANINNALNDIVSSDSCCRLTEKLIPITSLTLTPLVMVIAPSAGIKTLKEYLAFARAHPNDVTYASAGAGSITQVLGEKVNLAGGVHARDIPYKAIGAELPDILAGNVMVAYLAPVVVGQHIRTGKLIALGVAGPRRVPIVGDTPTLAEAGLPGVEASGWNGLFAPAGTPPNVITRLQTETAALLASPEFRSDAVNLGYELGGESPEAFTTFVKAEVSKWRGVIRDAKLKTE